jgi:hypothetical protein
MWKIARLPTFLMSIVWSSAIRIGNPHRGMLAANEKKSEEEQCQDS